MKILVIRFSSLGDLVTLEPQFRAIRFFFPNAEISLLTSSVGISLYKGSDYFDVFYKHQSIRDSIKNIRDKFELILNLQCNRPSHIIAYFLAHKKIVNITYSFAQKFLYLKYKPKTWQEFFLISGVAKETQEKYWQMNNSKIIHLPIDNDKRFIDISESTVVAVSTGSSQRWLSKKWGVDKYNLLISKLINKGITVVLVGSDIEKYDEKRITKKNPTIKSYVGKTSLSELKQLLSEVDIFVGNDSGPSHIAAGVGTKTITIFGSTSVKSCVKNLPYYGVHRCIVPDVSVTCHPCHLSKCPTHHECMESISVDDVFDQVIDMLGMK